MLGSLHDAEDVVQDTLLNAWRGMPRFEGRSSVRHWLYRIATNRCLRVIERRATHRRLMPPAAGPPVAFAPLGSPATDTPWLEPYPDAEIEAVADPSPGPDVRYERREATTLAFLSAIQALPPRQRAALVLRDVLAFSAAETADVLETSVASINSSLQRARSSMARLRVPQAKPSSIEQRDLLKRYVTAWESADIEGFVQLLAEDATWTMPPWREWYVGRGSIRAFLAWIWDPSRPRRHRMQATSANGQPAFGYYRSDVGGGELRPWALQVLDLSAGAIASVTNFVDPDLFPRFGLPSSLPADR